MRNLRWIIFGTLLAFGLAGCGGADAGGEIEKSPYAPTQDQFDQMKQQMMKNAPGKPGGKRGHR